MCLDDVVVYPDESAYVLKLTLAILGPIVVLAVLGSVVILVLRNRHHKRLLAIRSLHTDPDGFCSSDDILRVTAAGDTTLRVC